MIFSKNRRDLNLIPEEQRTLKTRRNRSIIVVGVVVILLAEAAIYVGTSVLQFSEQTRQESIAKQTDQKNAQWQKIASVAATAKNIKTKINLLESFPKKYLGVETGIAKVKEVIPTGVKLTNLTVSSDGKTQFDGITSDPAAILQLLNILEANTATFSATKLEQVNKTGETEYMFKISLTVKANEASN